MSEKVKVTHVKCKCSVALTPNNLTTSSSSKYCAYLHRNEAHIIEQSGMHDVERVGSLVAQYADRDSLTECKYVTAGGADYLVCVSLAGGIYVFNATGQKLVAEKKIPAAGGDSRRVRMSGITSSGGKGKNIIAVGSGSGVVYVFDVDSKVSLGQCNEVDTGLGAITALTHADNTLVVGDELGCIIMYDTSGGACAEKARLEGHGFHCLSLASGHGFVVGGFSTGHLRMYSIEEGRIVVEVAAHTRMVNAVAVHPHEAIVACAAEDTFVSAWSLPTKKNNRKVEKRMLVSPNSSLLTGVAFIDTDKSGITIAAVAYDSRYISMMKFED